MWLCPCITLISKPKIILADEPTGALDSTTSMEVMDILQEINDTGITIVIVTHERDIAERTQRSIKLRDGVIENVIHHSMNYKTAV
jgi:putative ABC transport system ATP-binding protein